MAYSYNDKRNAALGTSVLSWEDWKDLHPRGTKKDYYKEKDKAELEARSDSPLSYADQVIQEQNAMIENEKKLRPGLMGKMRIGLNKLKNRILHPFVSRDLENDAKLAEAKDAIGRVQAAQESRTPRAKTVVFPQYPMNIVANPFVGTSSTFVPNTTYVPTNTVVTNTAPDVRYTQAAGVTPAYQTIVASFTPKQKSYWGKIMYFSGATPYNANSPQVKDAIAQANAAQAQADQLRAQAQTVQAIPPAPVLYPTQAQPVSQYGGGVYAQPQQYTYQPNLAPGTNQIAVRAQNDLYRRPSLLDDAKAFLNRTGEKIGSYLDSKGIDREKAKKAALYTAIGAGGLGVGVLGSTLSKRRLAQENEMLRAELEDIRAKLEDRQSNSRSSRRKKKRDDYYDDDEDDDGGDDYREERRSNRKKQKQQSQGAISITVSPEYAKYSQDNQARKRRGMKSQTGKRL